MTSLGSLLHRWFDEFHLQANRQYVKGAKSDIRQIAAMTKRDVSESRSVRDLLQKGQPAEDLMTKEEAEMVDFEGG
jgi:hypothetical protein